MDSRPRVQLKGSLQLSPFNDQQLPSVSPQHHSLPFPFGQPGMCHEVLGLPFGQGAGQQLQAVLSCLEAFEDAAANHTDNAVAFSGCSRIEQALKSTATSHSRHWNEMDSE